MKLHQTKSEACKASIEAATPPLPPPPPPAVRRRIPCRPRKKCSARRPRSTQSPASESDVSTTASPTTPIRPTTRRSRTTRSNWPRLDEAQQPRGAHSLEQPPVISTSPAAAPNIRTVLSTYPTTDRTPPAQHPPPEDEGNLPTHPITTCVSLPVPEPQLPSPAPVPDDDSAPQDSQHSEGDPRHGLVPRCHASTLSSMKICWKLSSKTFSTSLTRSAASRAHGSRLVPDDRIPCHANLLVQTPANYNAYTRPTESAPLTELWVAPQGIVTLTPPPYTTTLNKCTNVLHPTTLLQFLRHASLHQLRTTLSRTPSRRKRWQFGFLRDTIRLQDPITSVTTTGEGWTPKVGLSHPFSMLFPELAMS
ncbi:extensin-like [Centruroides sculpturatus]|uniref:extensin-like n=1 Tax=Centruroides sculpturatus TaxID=218467 RepID=UPI000C6DE2D3|nr:extensin-like [Centruroides sculpturatus]